jgi:alpha-N-arabinofuranosidase
MSRSRISLPGRWAILVVLAVLVLASLRLVRVSGVSAANLILNGRFEVGHSEVPTSWNLDRAVKGRGSLRIDTSAPPGDHGSLELTPNANNTDKEKPFGVGQLIAASDLKGKSVRIRAFLKAEGGATAQFLAFAITPEFRPLGHAILVENSPQYREQTATFTVDREAAQILVGCVVVGQKGKAWFADLSLQVEGAPASSAPQAAPGQTLDSTIVVDAGKVLRTIPRLLYGANVEWIYDANGIWDARASKFDPAILRAAKELGVTLVRFPGGVFADYYHWKDGVGAQSARPVRPHVADGNKSGNGFGTAELVEFSRAIGAEPLLQVNMITGSPEEAAAWVSYCNNPNDADRIRNGARSPFNVHYWEIGNEQYGTADNPNTAKSSLTPEEYSARYLRFAAAMKKADSSIRLVAAGGVNSARYVAVTNNDWDRILLERAGSMIDFLAVHDAYAPLAASISHVPFDDVYRALLAFPQLVSQNLGLVSQQVEKYAGGPASHIQIAITEWGPLFHIIPSDPWVDHPKTLGSGLYVAEVMQSFLRSPRTGMANFFKLTEQSFLGCIGPRGEPKPSYYAFQMYTKHFGELLVDTREEGPRFSSRDVGNAGAVNSAPVLNTVSSLSADRARLYLIGVNTSSTSSVRTNIRLQGFRPVSTAKLWVLSGPSLDANNGEDLPAVPGLKWAKQSASAGDSFQRGHPGMLRPQEGTAGNVASQFTYVFPPMSVVSMEMSRAK